MSEYYEYNSVTSVKNKKQLSIIRAKLRKVKMRNFLLGYLRYRGSNKNMNFTDCNRTEGSFDKESIKNKYACSLNMGSILG